jgi:serine O-acetyltransferase
MTISPVKELIDTIIEKDPAAKTRLEVILCYPGFHALLLHMVAHQLWQKGLTTLARFISHVGRVLTGIEIHPGATIGRRVFIDHGMGVVIGETAIVGEDVVIYQGVTLGAGAAARQGALTRDKKRHPTLGKGVIVGSNAEVQGAITVGDNARVASGSIVLKDVPPNSVVVGVPGRVIYKDGEKVVEDIPADIEAEAIKCLKDAIGRLEIQLDELRHKLGASGNAEALENGQRLAGAQSAPAAPDSNKGLLDPVDVFLHGAGI